MAEKHKSKYKTPKDFEKSQKPHARKDVKDYTHDDKQGKLNPFSTGKKQEKVARKTDKAVQDDGKLYQKYTDNDRLYDPESAEYDPKHAAKVLNKRQKTDSDEYLKKLELIDHGVTTPEIQERLNRLTSNQKELLVREYIRRKILKVLREQPETPEDAPADDAAKETPASSTDAQPKEDPAPETPAPAPTAPAPTAPAPAPTTTPEAPATTTPPAGDADAAKQDSGEADVKKDVEQQEAENILAIKKWLEFLKQKRQKGPNSMVSAAISPLAKLIAKLGPEDLERAKNIAIRQIKSINPPQEKSDSESEQSAEQ